MRQNWKAPIPAVVLSLCLGIGGFALASLAAAGEIVVRQVTALDSVEPYEAQAFHDGYLWVGRNRSKAKDTFYQVEVYDASGSRLLASAMVPHTLGFIYPFGPQRTVIVGKAYDDSTGWRTYYTTATFDGSRVTTRTSALPLAVQVEQFAGQPGEMYFTEVGEAKVFGYAPLTGVRWIEQTVSGPGKMLLIGDELWVIERRSIYPGDENLVRLATDGSSAKRVFPELRNNLSNILRLDGFDEVAVTESWSDQVLLVDRATGKIRDTVAVAGSPRGLAQVGGCLAVFAPLTKHLSFIDLRLRERQVVAEWDVSAVGELYKNIRHLATDPKSGRFYLRSYYTAEFPDNLSGVFVVEETGGETVRKCQSTVR